LSLLSREITMEEYGDMCKQEGKTEVAKALKEAGVEVSIISKTTGLPEEEIDQL